MTPAAPVSLTCCRRNGLLRESAVGLRAAQRLEQLRRILEELNRRAALVAAGTPERSIDWRSTFGVRRVDLGAMRGKEGDDVVPPPESCAEQRRLPGSFAAAAVGRPGVDVSTGIHEQLQRGDRCLLDVARSSTAECQDHSRGYRTPPTRSRPPP